MALYAGDEVSHRILASNMCGIAGYRGFREALDSDVAGLLSGLRHRGPNGEYGSALIHTRLRAIDLSYAGYQPMGCSDARTATSIFVTR